MSDEERGIVVITGAASGIGRAVALDQARRGAMLALLDVNARDLEAVAAQAVEAGAQWARAWICDVSDEHRVVEVFSELEGHGRVSAAFANAGIEHNVPAHQMSMNTWQTVLDVNLNGAFIVCREAIRAMLGSGPGSIVCTSSPAAFQGFVAGGNAAYAASKGGIGAFVRSLAVDYASHGIRVNAVVPGAVDTPILFAEVTDGDVDELREQMAKDAREQIPLGRLARADEIAEAVSWLLGPSSSYVTGAHLVCDGGLMARSSNTF